MCKSTRTCLLGAALLCACKTPEPAPGVTAHATPTVEAPRLTGRVQTHDGSSLKSARLSVFRNYIREPEFELSLKPDGRFRATLPGPGVYVLQIVAVDHTPLRRAFAVDSGVVEVEARLGTPVRDFDGERLGLRLRYVDHAGVVGAPLEVTAVPVEGRGVYGLSLDPPAGASAVQYQLVAPNGRRFSGPGAESWVEDHSGEFWAERQLDDEAWLEVALSDLPPSGLEPEFQLRGEGVVSSRDAEVKALLENLRMRLHEASGGAGEQCEAILDAAADTRAIIEALHDHALRAFAALAWGQMLGRDGCLGKRDLRWVLEVVPADHVAWAFQGVGVHDLFAGMIDDPLVQGARKQLAAAQTDPGLRAHLLYLDIVDAERRGDATSVRETYATLTREYPSAYSTKIAKEAYDPDRPLQVGRLMPAWSFTGLDGEPVRAADFQGRPYLLEVWATWCGPCINEMEFVHTVWETLGADEGPVSFVWVSVDTEPDQVRAFRRERWPMPWIHAHEPDEQALFDAWWFGGIPMPVLVDGEGRIVATTDALRGDALRSTLLEFTGEGSKPISH